MAVVAALGAAGGGGVDQEEMDRIKADMEAEIRSAPLYDPQQADSNRHDDATRLTDPAVTKSGS